MIADAEHANVHAVAIDGLMKYFSGISTYGIEEYLSEIEKHPILSEHEEQMLAERVYSDNDDIALEKLVLSNLRLVARIALETFDSPSLAGLESPFDAITSLYDWSVGATAPAKALSYRRALPASGT